MSLVVIFWAMGGGGVYTYNFMLYMIGRRLNNSLLTRFMRTRPFVCLLSPMLSYFPVFFVPGRCVDKGSPDRKLQRKNILTLSLLDMKS